MFGKLCSKERPMAARSRRPYGAVTRAFTLVEMLVAMVLTLIMVAAIAEFYAFVGETVKDGRAMIEMSGGLRTAVQRLKSDLELLTLPVTPWTDDAGAWGYFEIGEGVASDCDIDGDLTIDSAATSPWRTDTNGDGITNYENLNITTLLGDADDYIAMTIRASGEPFTGRFGTGISTGLHAEVIWWVGFDDVDGDGLMDLNEPRQIYRRQLLIRPDASTAGPIGEFAFNQGGLTQAFAALHNYWQLNDISASIRQEVNSSGTTVLRIRANSLADLSRRERRFAHVPFRLVNGNLVDNFPYPCDLLPSISANSPNVSPIVANNLRRSYVLQNAAGAARGEDIVLSNVLAMDVRVYDPNAPQRADVLQTSLNTDAVNALTPGDPGFLATITNNPVYPQIAMGAFVDLGYGDTTVLQLQQPPYNLTLANAQSVALNGLGSNTHFGGQSSYFTTTPSIGHTYDTWSLSYERDGLNQDWSNWGPTYDNVANINTGPFDEGTNGLDDDGINGVDDIGERETHPPFGKPLRGVQVRVRIHEPGTRQVRQATVAGDFIPE
jgi:hypothetical protein